MHNTESRARNDRICDRCTSRSIELAGYHASSGSLLYRERHGRDRDTQTVRMEHQHAAQPSIDCTPDTSHTDDEVEPTVQCTQNDDPPPAAETADSPDEDTNPLEEDDKLDLVHQAAVTEQDCESGSDEDQDDPFLDACCDRTVTEIHTRRMEFTPVCMVLASLVLFILFCNIRILCLPLTGGLGVDMQPVYNAGGEVDSRESVIITRTTVTEEIRLVREHMDSGDKADAIVAVDDSREGWAALLQIYTKLAASCAQWTSHASHDDDPPPMLKIHDRLPENCRVVAVIGTNDNYRVEYDCTHA